MWLLRERLSDFREKNLQTLRAKSELLKSYIELIALYVHPKNSIAIMALDHSRLGLENKSGRIFCVRQVYFTKSCQQVWGRVNQPFILFIHHIWGETVLWGAVFIIQTSDKMQYFTIFQDKLHSFNIQNRTKHAWAFSKTVKKISKITYISRADMCFNCSLSIKSMKFGIMIVFKALKKIGYGAIAKKSVKYEK